MVINGSIIDSKLVSDFNKLAKADDKTLMRSAKDDELSRRIDEAVSLMTLASDRISAAYNIVEEFVNGFRNDYLDDEFKTLHHIRNNESGMKLKTLENTKRGLQRQLIANETQGISDIQSTLKEIDNVDNKISFHRSYINSRKSELVKAQKTHNNNLKGLKNWFWLKKICSIINLAFVIRDGIELFIKAKTIQDKINSANINCPEAADEVSRLISEYRTTIIKAATVYSIQLGTTIADIYVMIASVAAIPLTGGSSLMVAATLFCIEIVKTVVLESYNNRFNNQLNSIKEQIDHVNDVCRPDEPRVINGRLTLSGGISVTVRMDPSGYVYEAVPSNRLEGVKAEAYYYDYALDEFGVPEESKSDIPWNAEDYDQINPLYTDANGEYAWDVPFGQWLVKFSKEGYYDTDSRNDAAVDDEGYLPVPPPQTEVNVGMVSKAAPTVEEINVYNDEIRIVFSQYMKPETVNTNTVNVTVNGSAVSGKIVALNAEYDYEKVNQYASKYAFVPDSELSGKVNVSVNNTESYNSKKITTAFVVSENVSQKPQSIEVQDEIAITYNSGALLEVAVLPAEAGAGKSLDVSSSSPSIVGIVNENIVLDENGKANIMLSGKLPGESEITIALEGSDLTKTVKASVSNVVPVEDRCEKVTANIKSGTTVEKGTTVELSTPTEGAEIYYTLDGTCPCTVDSSSRIKYTGPIEINEETFLIAYAVKDGMEESYTAGFTYFIKDEASEEHKIHTAASAVEENRHEASCTNEGSYDVVVYCTTCGYEISRDTITIPKKEHSFVTDYGYAATCTNNGLTQGSHCQACGFVQTPQYTINATGHQWGYSAVTQEPTTTSEGVETYYCAVCNAIIGNKAIAKLPKGVNTLTVKAKTATIKYAKVKSKKQTVAVKSVLAISKAKGKVSYEKKSGNKGITINKTTGKVTVKKGLKKGTYKIKVKVKAAGDDNYNSAAKTVTFKIKVK
jgi:hypothetical protein